MKPNLLLGALVFASMPLALAQEQGAAPPKRAVEYVARGNKLADQGKFEAAEAEYKKVIEAAPDWYEPYYELGYMYWNQGKQNKDKALAKLETALKLNPRCWLCYMVQANIADDTGDPDVAVALYQKAGEIEPRSGQIWYNLAVVHFRQKRTDEAIRILKKAQEVEPKYASPYYLLGMIYVTQGRFFLAHDELFAFVKLETKGPRFEKAKELTDVHITIDESALGDESLVATMSCIARAAVLSSEEYRKKHLAAETYGETLDDEAEYLDSLGQMLLETSENGKRPVPARFAPLVKVKQAGFLKEFVIAASGDRFAKDKATLPAGRMEKFTAWAKENMIRLEIPQARCEVRWMGRTW